MFPLHLKTYAMGLRPLPSKHDTLKQCWFDVGPTSSTLAQYQTNIVLMCRVCWVYIFNSFSAGIDYRRQILTSKVDPLYERVTCQINENNCITLWLKIYKYRNVV